MTVTAARGGRLVADIDLRPGVENHDAAARIVGRAIAELDQPAYPPAAVRHVAGKIEENEVGTIARRIDQRGDVTIGVADHSLLRHLANGPAGASMRDPPTLLVAIPVSDDASVARLAVRNGRYGFSSCRHSRLSVATASWLMQSIGNSSTLARLMSPGSSDELCFNPAVVVEEAGPGALDQRLQLRDLVGTVADIQDRPGGELGRRLAVAGGGLQHRGDVILERLDLAAQSVPLAFRRLQCRRRLFHGGGHGAQALLEPPPPRGLLPELPVQVRDHVPGRDFSCGLCTFLDKFTISA